MPTLHQIGISSPTREKLARAKRPRPDEDIPTSTRNTDKNSFVPIRTPSSLLSRNPHQLCRLLDVSLDNLKTIRAGVADAIVADETTGHSDVAEIIHAVEGRFAADFANNNFESCGPFHPTLHPPQLIVGSISALELAAHSMCVGSTQHVSTGSQGLDQLIGTEADLNMSLGYPFKMRTNDNNSSNNNRSGGVPFGFVTEVCGPPSSGKTQFCLNVIAHALQMHSRVIYITSGNSLSISRRLIALCVERLKGTSENGNDAELKQTAFKQIERVSIVPCSDGYTLLSLLSKIEHEELRNNNDGIKFTLLVIDSISAVIGHHLSNLTAGAALVSQVGMTLRRMSRTLDGRFANRSDSNESPRRFGVVIANGTVANWFDTSDKNHSKPAMGRYWHVSDIGLWLDEEPQDEQPAICDFYQDGLVGLHHGNRKIVTATVTNHWAKKCGGHARFVVRSGGLYDA